MTVDPDSATPLYVQVAGLLRGRIEAGELTSRLPSLKTIAQQYDVSHITAEKAIQVLKDEGLVESVVGKGTYVKRLALDHPHVLTACGRGSHVIKRYSSLPGVSTRRAYLPWVLP